MHVTHRKRFVSRDLVALAARRPQELAALSEAHYHDQIESIADEVLAAGQRIVMLTGPSAAGKTTSAHKIADAIAARGHRSQVISLDDFYIGEGKYCTKRAFVTHLCLILRFSGLAASSASTRGTAWSSSRDCTH
mgnify:CR=1 FL=1